MAEIATQRFLCPGCELSLELGWQIDSGRSLWRCGSCGLWTLEPRQTQDPSALYDDAYYAGGYLPRIEIVERFFRDQLVELERTISKGSLLDVGCGLGLFVSEAAKRGWRATGLDPSASAVKEARRRTAGLDGTEIIQGSLESPPAFPGRFDLVTFWDSLCHVSDLKANLRAAAGALKPGGYLVIKAALRPNRAVRWDLLFGKIKKSWGEAALHLATQWHQISPRTLEVWAPRLGLEMIRSYKVDDPGEKESVFAPPYSRARVAQHFIEGMSQRLAGADSFVAILRRTA